MVCYCIDSINANEIKEKWLFKSCKFANIILSQIIFKYENNK